MPVSISHRDAAKVGISGNFKPSKRASSRLSGRERYSSPKPTAHPPFNGKIRTRGGVFMPQFYAFFRFRARVKQALYVSRPGSGVIHSLEVPNEEFRDSDQMKVVW